LGWWFLYDELLGAENNRRDWIKIVKAASSGYVLRITNILSRLQNVENMAL
jgi:hypothetical protein